MTCADVRDLAPAYVLGALDPAEEAEVRAHLATCPDAHAELAELGEGAGVLMASVPLVQPPASLKARIMAEAARDLVARAALAAPVVAAPATGPVALDRPARAPAPARSPAPEARRPGFRESLFGRTRSGWAMAAVAVVGILVIGAWNLALQGELAGTRSYQERLEAALALARQPGAQLALLSPAVGTEGPTGVAVLPSTGEGRLVMTGLAPTAGSQVYEAWTIVEGQAPVPVGGFTVGADGVGYLEGMPTAVGGQLIVAITLEPGPNPTAPSSAPVSLGIAAPVVTVPAAA